MKIMSPNQSCEAEAGNRVAEKFWKVPEQKFFKLVDKKPESEKLNLNAIEPVTNFIGLEALAKTHQMADCFDHKQ